MASWFWSSNSASAVDNSAAARESRVREGLRTSMLRIFAASAIAEEKRSGFHLAWQEELLAHTKQEPRAFRPMSAWKRGEFELLPPCVSSRQSEEQTAESVNCFLRDVHTCLTEYKGQKREEALNDLRLRGIDILKSMTSCSDERIQTLLRQHTTLLQALTTEPAETTVTGIKTETATVRPAEAHLEPVADVKKTSEKPHVEFRAGERVQLHWSNGQWYSGWYLRRHAEGGAHAVVFGDDLAIRIVPGVNIRSAVKDATSVVVKTPVPFTTDAAERAFLEWCGALFDLSRLYAEASMVYTMVGQLGLSEGKHLWKVQDGMWKRMLIVSVQHEVNALDMYRYGLQPDSRTAKASVAIQSDRVQWAGLNFSGFGDDVNYAPSFSDFFGPEIDDRAALCAFATVFVRPAPLIES